MTQRRRSTQDIRSERRIRNNRIRRIREMRKNFLLFVMTLCLIATTSIAVSSFRSNAKGDPAKETCRYYKSITVSERDTLWSIAETYMDEMHYDSIQDYISDVMHINNLKNDAIYADAHLIVPYYAEAPVQ
ncbi:MAG: LysM peptidoglycan-binding domain-containing protein [Lachnospiraceae bacterium]|nr:LysM peptidoglycan-binding domain-containing protein [Clostridium sp.]MCM1225728.1 LysM peptidoglycan-binding domain-containing protein [Lachnospiraceae bacterium]